MYIYAYKLTWSYKEYSPGSNFPDYQLDIVAQPEELMAQPVPVLANSVNDRD